MTKKILLISLGLLFLTGCAATNRVYNSTTSLTPPLDSSVAILPADVEISLLNAGGNLEPRAEWSAAAAAGLYSALEEFFFEKGIMPISYGAETISDDDVDVIRQANINLDAIELSQARGSMPGLREYALTDDIVNNLEKYNADYALLVMLRASQASGGRQVVGILAAIGGVAIDMGSASYRVALFDLRDGQVAWANFDPVALGGLGNPAEATNEQWQKSFETLFEDFPL